VFHSLIVVSYCRPGSAHDHAACAIWSHRSWAGSVFETRLSVRRTSCHASSRSTASKKAFETRTELLEFWPETVMYASEVQFVS
jgi:hypothetical protein